MTKKMMIVAVLCCTGALLLAQQAQLPIGLNVPSPQGAAAPAPEIQPGVAPQPSVKSQEELDAVQAILKAIDPLSRIKASENLVANFTDSEFISFALQMAAISAQQMNDYDQLMLYGERTLEADPNNYTVMLAMASALAQKTREFDLDKEEKLKRAESYANKSIEILEDVLKPNPTITDEQWDQAKGDFAAQAHEALGSSAMVRKEYDVATKEYKTAIELAFTPNQVVEVRLGAVLYTTGKYDEAIAVFDKLLATPNLNPQIKKVADAERLIAVQAKEKGQ